MEDHPQYGNHIWFLFGLVVFLLGHVFFIFAIKVKIADINILGHSKYPTFIPVFVCFYVLEVLWVVVPHVKKSVL